MNKTRRTFFRIASATGIEETIASVAAFEMETGRSLDCGQLSGTQPPVEWLPSAQLHWKDFREAARSIQGQEGNRRSRNNL